MTNLQGMAKQWYEGLPTIDFTWVKWKDKLCKAFSDKRDYANKLSVMVARAKIKDKNMMIFEKSALVRFRRKSSCITQRIVAGNAETRGLRNTAGIT